METARIVLYVVLWHSVAQKMWSDVMWFAPLRCGTTRRVWCITSWCSAGVCEQNTPPEKTTKWESKLSEHQSRAGEQVLLPDCGARARMKGDCGARARMKGVIFRRRRQYKALHYHLVAGFFGPVMISNRIAIFIGCSRGALLEALYVMYKHMLSSFHPCMSMLYSLFRQ